MGKPKRAQKDEDDDRIPLPPVPWSVFYRCNKPHNCHSFKKPYELREAIDLERERRNAKRRKPK